MRYTNTLLVAVLLLLSTAMAPLQAAPLTGLTAVMLTIEKDTPLDTALQNLQYALTHSPTKAVATPAAFERLTRAKERIAIAGQSQLPEVRTFVDDYRAVMQQRQHFDAVRMQMTTVLTPYFQQDMLTASEQDTFLKALKKQTAAFKQADQQFADAMKQLLASTDAVLLALTS